MKTEKIMPFPEEYFSPGLTAHPPQRVKHPSHQDTAPRPASEKSEMGLEWGKLLREKRRRTGDRATAVVSLVL